MEDVSTPELMQLAVDLTADIHAHRYLVSDIGKKRRNVYRELLIRGTPYSEIANVTGLHKMTIYKDVKNHSNSN